jgi:predicted acetyltransferase
MGYVVRPIAAGEMADWVRVVHVAFHSGRSAEEEARHRLEVRGQDLSRTLAAVDDTGEIVGSYFSFQAELSLPGTGACVPTDAVTAVAVMPTHHRRGVLRQMITADLQAARERGEAASILIAAEYPIYGRFGFGPATEQAAYRLATAHAQFVRETKGTIEMLSRERMREIAPRLFDQFRRTCPGQIDREPIRWDVRLGLRPSPGRQPEDPTYYAVCTAAGAREPSGYLVYSVHGDWQHQVPQGRVEIDELIALDPEAYLGLWRYCAEIDLVSEVTAELRSIHEPLPWLLSNPRKAIHELVRADFLWLRPLDTPRLLAARRYVAEDRLIFEVDDPLGLSGGRFVLEGGRDGAVCTATQQSPQLRMSMTALGALSLGGTELRPMAAAGHLQEEAPGALDRAAQMFAWPSSPWCSTFF